MPAVLLACTLVLRNRLERALKNGELMSAPLRAVTSLTSCSTSCARLSITP